MTQAPPPRATRIGQPAPGRQATRIGEGVPPKPATAPTAAALSAPAPPTVPKPGVRPAVTGIAGQRRQRREIDLDAAKRLLTQAGIDPPGDALLRTAIERFQTIVWPTDRPARVVEEAGAMGDEPQRRLRQLCDEVLVLQQSRLAAELSRHLGRIHDLLGSIGERIAGQGVRNALLDWMGGEVLPANVQAELRQLQHEVMRLEAPADAEIAALTRHESDSAGLLDELGAWGLACRFTPLLATDDTREALARSTHQRLESLLRSQGLAAQQRQVIDQLLQHLRELRHRAHEAVLNDLPAWLAAVAALPARANPTERYALRVRLQALTERLET